MHDGRTGYASERRNSLEQGESVNQCKERGHDGSRDS